MYKGKRIKGTEYLMKGKVNGNFSLIKKHLFLP